MKTRLNHFLREKIPWRDILLLSLIYSIQRSLLLSMDVVVRGVTAEVLNPLLVSSMFFGWVLVRSRLGGWGVGALTAGLGLLAAVSHVGKVDRAVGRFLVRGWGYLEYRLREGEFPPAQEVFDSLLLVEERTVDILNTIWHWTVDVRTGFSAYNQTVIQVIWGAVLIFLTVWFCWAVFRYFRPLWGLLPSGSLLSTLLTYTPGHRNLIIYTLGSGLALVGLVFYAQKEKEWKTRGVSNPTLPRKNITWTILGISLTVMILAAIIPSVRVKALSDPIQEWLWEKSDSQDTILRSMGVEYDPGVSAFNVERAAGMPRSHLIRSGPELEKRVVMVVRFPPGSPDVEEIPRTARYWKAYTYDQYTGSGWKSSETVEEVYQPGQQLFEETEQFYSPLVQEIRISNQLRGALYAAGVVKTVDREFQVSWRTTAEDPLQVEDPEQLILEDIFAISLDNILYQVRSSLLTADDDVLRNTPLDYPEWIENRYLDLPDTVPERVLNLAAEVVAAQPTAYDQAKAIEAFLRTYPYTLDLPDPLSNRDVADYFLFDLQKGYCDYYATSMVVLARAVGLPSRVAIGYVGGRYDPDDDRYLVVEADAHTWPEIYFTDVGWVPFEPTAGRSAIDQEGDSLPVPPELDKPPQTFQGLQKDRPGVPPLIFWAAGSVLVFWLIWAISGIDLVLLSRKKSPEAVKVLYLRLYRFGDWLNLELSRSTTPFEFQILLEEKITQLEGFRGHRTLISSILRFSEELTDHYVLAVYSSRLLGDGVQKTVINSWKAVRWQLLRLGMISKGKDAVSRFRRWIFQTTADDLPENGEKL